MSRKLAVVAGPPSSARAISGPLAESPELGRKLRILLIDPTDPWVTNNKLLKHLDQVMLPIGLMALSAYLKQFLAEQLEIRVISTIVDVSSEEDLAEQMRRFQPDIVGVRCVIFYSEEAAKIFQLTRRVLPQALTIAGGPNVTFDNENLRHNQDIDVMVNGEGEQTLLDIVQLFLAQGKAGVLAARPHILGIMYPGEQGLIGNPPRAAIEDLDSLPIPDYEVVNLDRYSRFLNYGYNRRRMGVLFTSRGCPFKCTYCHVSFGKGFRARSAKKVHEEIVYLRDKYQIEDFCIVDDNFTVHRRRVEEFTQLLIENGPKVNLYFPNGLRADSLDDRLLEGMRAAGTIYMTFSLETAVQRLQKEIRKHANVAKLTHIVQRACDLGIITNLCIMVGFPTETLQDAEQTLQYFSQFDRVVLPYYFSVKYYPGTEIFHSAPKQGVAIDEERYRAPYHGYEFQETALLSRRDFERLNQWYLRRIYLNPRRLENAVSILSSHFSEHEVKEMFSLFFRREVRDVEKDVLQASQPWV